MSFCGIDFGTSNSAIAIGTPKGPALVPLEGTSVTMPSALFYAVNSPSPVFGRAAQLSFFEGEEGRFMRSLKRMLGTGLMSQGTVVNGKTKTFETIIGDFISRLKTSAEPHTGRSLDSVVMGRPVRFTNDGDSGDKAAQDQLEKISRAAGFRHVEFQFEPIAAALAHERTLTEEKLALVIDIGGGTSDFSVIRLSAHRAKKADRREDILGNAGARLGGNDFDKALSLSAFMPSFGYHTTYGPRQLPLPESPFHDLSEWSRVNFLYTPRFKSEMTAISKECAAPEKFGRFVHILERETGHRVLTAVEECKINLTKKTAATASLDFAEKGLRIPVTRQAFNTAISAHIEKISETLSECLSQAEVQSNSIEMVILTGGPTETPLLRKMIQKRFPAALFSEENRLSSVATGLGYDATLRFQT